MYQYTVEQAIAKLKTSRNGLSNSQAQVRLEQYGENILKETKKVSALKIFIAQFMSAVVAILIAALLISLILGEFLDAIVIGVILVANAILGFVQEYKAEKAIDALKKLTSLKSKVIRDGRVQEIESRLLVPGDIILLETGAKIDCDARLIEVFNLETQEAALTGESTPVRKTIDILQDRTQLADRHNMVFSGTLIANGRAKAVVSETGMHTELGKIAALIQEEKEKPTPLQIQFEELGKFLGILVVIISILIFAIGYLQGDPLFAIFFVAVSIAVAAIPEGLPAVITISLALGVQRMIKKNVLVRKLSSVETLGSTTVICTDKTGTLTHNEMTVKELYVNGKSIEVTGSGYVPEGTFTYEGKKVQQKEVELLLTIGALNNDAVLSSENKIIGDPTEGALLVAAQKAGLAKLALEQKLPRINELGFDSQRKRMTTIHGSAKESVAYVKGAPDILLSLCTHIHENGKVRPLTAFDKKKIGSANEEYAQQALRVLAFAYKPVNDTKALPETEKNLIFVGLQAMIDPPRPEVKESIERCSQAGIRIIMVTGDHTLTAQAIAQELGISGKAITGEELEGKKLDEIIDDYAIYARASPHHKSQIIDALRTKGHIIAMTGDGVNDAPALKKADIGVAMGVSGTDVAKEASHMILTNDNFKSIVDAVEEGRGIYDNIKKYFAYLISGNIAEVLVIFLALVLGPYILGASSKEILPLSALQILLINLATDGLPAVALGVDPYEPHAMKQRPRNKNERIYKGISHFIIWTPLLMTLVALSVFFYIYMQDFNLLKAQTATFLTIAAFEFYIAFSVRSLHYPSLQVGIFKNKWLFVAVISSFAVTLAVIYTPFLNGLFKTTPLSLFEFATIMALSSLGFIYLELYKYIQSKRKAHV